MSYTVCPARSSPSRNVSSSDKRPICGTKPRPPLRFSPLARPCRTTYTRSATNGCSVAMTALFIMRWSSLRTANCELWTGCRPIVAARYAMRRGSAFVAGEPTIAHRDALDVMVRRGPPIQHPRVGLHFGDAPGRVGNLARARVDRRLVRRLGEQDEVGRFRARDAERGAVRYRARFGPHGYPLDVDHRIHAMRVEDARRPERRRRLVGDANGGRLLQCSVCR